jgi:transporter family protein
MKISTRNGMNVSSFLTLVGAAVFCVGLCGVAFHSGWSGNARSALAAVAMGFTWSLAIAGIVYGLSALQIPVSIIAPLTNSNAVVAVVLSAIVFNEWQQLSVGRLLIGVALIVMGAIVVSIAPLQISTPVLSQRPPQYCPKLRMNPNHTQITQSFTEADIRAAYAKVKSGPDFPALVRDLKNLGIRSYDHVLAAGANVFRGANGHAIRLGQMGPAVPVADHSDVPLLLRHIAAHQKGLSDYPTICRQAGEAGVAKWVSDLDAMTVTYLDTSDNVMHVEAIPAGDYGH